MQWITTGLLGSVLLMLAAFPSSAQVPSPTIRKLDPQENTVTVAVNGVADDARADKAQAAKLDAFKKAIEQAAGLQVENKDVAVNNVLSSFTEVTRAGFVEDSTLLGSPKSDGTNYIQAYQIKVRIGEINRELVKGRIDVKFLYDVVSRPRICLAITDEEKNIPEAGGSASYSGVSSSKITQYFLSRNPNFIFKDLALLRKSANESVDYVREAANNGFDVLILGTTRWMSQLMPPKPSTYNEPGHPPFRQINNTINWRVIKVATSENIWGIFGEKEMQLLLTDSTNKYGLINEKAAELFRELLAYWNRSAFREAYEISFESSETKNAPQLQTRLRQVQAVDTDSLRILDSGKVKLTFSVVITGSLSELLSSLATVFKDQYEILSARPGKVELIAVKDKNSIISLKIRNSTLLFARQIREKLPTSEGIRTVEQGPFSQGELTLSITTARPAEYIGEELERLFGDKIRILDISAKSIAAEYRQPAP